VIYYPAFLQELIYTTAFLSRNHSVCQVDLVSISEKFANSEEHGRCWHNLSFVFILISKASHRATFTKLKSNLGEGFKEYLCKSL
jgi:hypothetical protein